MLASESLQSDTTQCWQEVLTNEYLLKAIGAPGTVAPVGYQIQMMEPTHLLAYLIKQKTFHRNDYKNALLIGTGYLLHLQISWYPK